MMEFIVRKKSMVIIALALLTASFLISFAFVEKSSAVPGLPFGGFVYAVTPCPCSGGLVLHVGPPRGGNFLYTDGTKLYPFEQVRAGVWVLGDYFPGGACTTFVYFDKGYTCVPIVDVTGWINFMGTSL